MHTSILVPLDGSALGNRALPFAMFLARRSFSKLHIVHVFRHVTQNSRAPAHDVSLDPELENLTRTVIRTQAELVPAADARSVTTAFLAGDVAPALAEYALANGIDLIVMTTRGHGEGHRPLIGSVTSEVIRRTTAPVLLVAHRSQDSMSPHEQHVDRILIALDVNGSSEAAIDSAVAFADPDGARFTLLASVAPALSKGLFGSSRRLDRRATKHAALAARTYLAGLARELHAHGFSAEVTVRVTDATDMGILELLEVKRFDLIALAVDGAEQALERMLGISFLERVVRRARSNLLICNTNAHRTDESGRAGTLSHSVRRPEPLTGSSARIQ